MKTETKEKIRSIWPKATIYRGVATVKRFYYYRHGTTEDNLAERVLREFPNAVIVEKKDCYHAWPKDSWFQVKFTIKEDNESATPATT